MSLTWNREQVPYWNADKQRIVGGQPDGVFPQLATMAEGDVVPGSWWRAEDDGAVVAYGWMDPTWGFAPVLVAVDPQRQGNEVGAWVMEQLAAEAKKEGLAYIFNVIPAEHPDKERLRRWLVAQGFEGSELDETMLRKKVG